MLACPLLPVAVTPLEEKLIPAEVKVTVAPGTGMAGVLASVTSTTSELLNAVPTVELCPLPETTADGGCRSGNILRHRSAGRSIVAVSPYNVVMVWLPVVSVVVA